MSVMGTRALSSRIWSTGAIAGFAAMGAWQQLDRIYLVIVADLQFRSRVELG